MVFNLIQGFKNVTTIPYDPQEIQKIINSIDKNKNGYIDYSGTLFFIRILGCLRIIIGFNY